MGRLPIILKLRHSIVQRIAEEMKKHHPGKEHSEYVRVGFIAVNSHMGVFHTMLFDETQTYTKEEIATELKTLLNAYFRKRASQ